MAKEKAGRTVVVAVDGGEESLYALSWYLKYVVGPPTPQPTAAAAEVEEGEKEGGERDMRAAAEEEEDSSGADTLVLVHAAPPRATYAAMDGTGYFLSAQLLESADQHQKEVAAAIMSKAKSLCAAYPHVKVQTIVDIGDPREVICEISKKKGADMLVMGTHGYGLIKRALLGSVSNHCVNNVQCPCLVVKNTN